MNDKLRLTVVGLILIALVGGPFYLAQKPRGPEAVLSGAARLKGPCLWPRELIRAKHGFILKEWQSLNRQGKRSGLWPLSKANGETKGAIIDYSLNTCFECHDNRRNFCLRCHDSLSLKTNCFSCHFSPEDKIEGFNQRMILLRQPADDRPLNFAKSS